MNSTSTQAQQFTAQMTTQAIQLFATFGSALLGLFLIYIQKKLNVNMKTHHELIHLKLNQLSQQASSQGAGSQNQSIDQVSPENKDSRV